jgi:hypothetical protein
MGMQERDEGCIWKKSSLRTVLLISIPEVALRRGSGGESKTYIVRKSGKIYKLDGYLKFSWTLVILLCP